MRETHLTGFQVFTAFTCFLGGVLLFVVGVTNVIHTDPKLLRWPLGVYGYAIRIGDELLKPAKIPESPRLPGQLRESFDHLNRHLPGASLVIRARPICLLAAGVFMMWAGPRLLRRSPRARRLLVWYGGASILLNPLYIAFEVGLVHPVIRTMDHFRPTGPGYGGPSEATLIESSVMLALTAIAMMSHAIFLLFAVALIYRRREPDNRPTVPSANTPASQVS
jgi:hypothetical protein